MNTATPLPLWAYAALGIVTFSLWLFIWWNAEDITKRIPWPIAFLFHIWLAGTWVSCAFNFCHFVNF